MGSFQAKEKSINIYNPRERERDVAALKAKVKFLKEEIKEIMSTRENESHDYEEEMMVFALKEAEWKRERKRLREEVKKLKKKVEEREGTIKRLMEDEKMKLVEGEEKDENEWKKLGNNYLMECMREERARRDEAVEKWKKLYLTIKTELDHLIKMTNQGEGERLSSRSEEEDLVDELHMELKAKDETIELLQEQLAAKEKEKSRMEREVDILRQSLRIMSHKKSSFNVKYFKKSLAKQT